MAVETFSKGGWQAPTRSDAPLDRKTLDTLRTDVDDLVQQVERLPPAATGRWLYTDVTFSVADEDVAISHTLRPADPETVRFIAVSRDGAFHVYRGGGASRRAWTRDTVWLRADDTGTARVLLFLEPSNA